MPESTTHVMDKTLSEPRQLETWLESEASGSTERACRKGYDPLNPDSWKPGLSQKPVVAQERACRKGYDPLNPDSWKPGLSQKPVVAQRERAGRGYDPLIRLWSILKFP